MSVDGEHEAILVQLSSIVHYQLTGAIAVSHPGAYDRLRLRIDKETI
jgi:hypothetical protein